jgi:RNA 2',3'-cyclic 3'-phosphodiesterase
MRIFFAVWPPPETARALAHWAREALPATGGKATDEAKIHITLAFLGDADEQRAIAAARRVTSNTHALASQPDRVGRPA